MIFKTELTSKWWELALIISIVILSFKQPNLIFWIVLTIPILRRVGWKGLWR